MKINYVSTLALNSSLRTDTLNKQSELVSLQKEISTGRKADIGASLGSFTSSAVIIENEISFIDQIQTTNSLVEVRLSSMQSGLDTLVASGNDFLQQATAQLSATIDRDILEAVGESAYGLLEGIVNTTVNNQYVFSGLNSDTEALVDYDGASGAAAKAAVQNAFTTHFGFAATSPAASTISKTDIEAFIDGPYADLFNDANWGTLWSGSSEFGVRSKISTREVVETPSTANAEAFRNSAAAAILFTEFSNSELNEDAMSGIASKAFKIMSNSIGELGIEQSKLGLVEERVEKASDRMEFQKNILTNQLSGLVDVDPYEAATKLNQLTTSLEASYSVTARIQSLSLMNFI